MLQYKRWNASAARYDVLIINIVYFSLALLPHNIYQKYVGIHCVRAGMCHLHEHVSDVSERKLEGKKNAITKSKAPKRKETIFRSDRVYTYYLLLYTKRSCAAQRCRHLHDLGFNSDTQLYTFYNDISYLYMYTLRDSSTCDNDCRFLW